MRPILTALLGLLAAIGTVEADPWTFLHRVIDSDPPAEERMDDIRIGDINSDGLPDIWTTGFGGGDGAYQMVWYKNPCWERFTIAPGDFKYGELADLNGDGTLDVVAGGDTDTSVHWFENNGSPQQPDWAAHDTGIPGSPDVIYVGDIDGDGGPDIVYLFKDAVGWAWPAGDPTLPWARREIWSGDRRTGGRVADIDLDGDLDILYGNAWYENPGPSGDPKTDSWSMHYVDSGWDVEARGAVADLNSDGLPDVVLSDEEGTHGVAWYEGPTDPTGGAWVKHVVHPSYEGVHSLELADFNRDGRLDIFAAEMHNRGQARVTVFECVDIASNLWEERVIGGTGSHNAKVGDIDGDGWPDVAGKNFKAGTLPMRVDLWLNRVGAPFALGDWERHILDTEALFNALFAVGGDLDGDGLPDIAAGDSWYRNPGEPSGAWEKNPIHASFKNVLAVWDIDQDGDQDLFGARDVLGTDFVWARNDGAGFTLQSDIPDCDADFVQGIRVAQILPGGRPEVVLSFHDGSKTSLLEIPDSPAAPWILTEMSTTSNGEQIAVQDIDGDGDLDVHLGTQWLRQEADRTWTTFDAVVLGDPEADPDRVELADVDLDGDWDVVIGCERVNRLLWGECPPDPTALWTEHVVAADFLYMSVDVADLDRDGDPDIVAGEHNGEGRVTLFQNGSNGASWTPYVVDPGLPGLDHHDGTQLLDLDGDGDLDIISVGWTSETVLFYENRATESEPGDGDATPPTAPENLRPLAVTETEIRLTWDHALDPESGISHYRVFRDQDHVGDEEANIFVDTGLLDNTTYVYEVSAVNGEGMEGPRSDPLRVTTAADSIPPVLLAARVDWEPTMVFVFFSEPLEEESAEDAGNYEIDRGVSVTGAALDEDETTVVLTTSPVTAGVFHTLTVNDVRDQATDPNTIEPNSRTTFVYGDPPAGGMLGHWNLDDGSGTVALDTSGNGNHGVVEGPEWTDGLQGGALHFDGVNDYVDLGFLDPPLGHRSGFAISAWFRAESFSNFRDNIIVAKTRGRLPGDYFWMLSTFKSDGRIQLRFRLRTDGGATTLTAAGEEIVTETWVHAVATYDGSTMRLYQDNLEVGRLFKLGEVSVDAGVRALMGIHPDESDEWHGLIDDVRLYYRSLTAAEIDSLYEAGMNQPSESDPHEDVLLPDIRIVTPVGGERILYYLPEASDVGIRLYDIGGRLLLSDELRGVPSGWNSYRRRQPGGGTRPTSGVFFLRLSALGKEKTAKVILLRD